MKQLSVDTRIGGLGDVWMRLHALHGMSALTPRLRIRVTVKPEVAEIAHAAFGSRLTIETQPGRGAIVFTHRGLSEIGPRILRGERFSPIFRRTILNDRPERSARDLVNDSLYSLFAAAGRVFLTDPRCLERFSGWLQISGLPPARGIPWEAARTQLMQDFPAIRARLQALVPDRPAAGTVIFPSGSSFQVMPPEFAREHFADAVFAFHPGDRYQKLLAPHGLKIVHFDTPAAMLALASRARHLVVTDSFPSHLLQSYTPRVIVALSHYPRRRIIHPAFDGRIVDSTAPCCPCLTLARKPGVRCGAGREDCLVWSDAVYLAKLQRTLADSPA